MRMLETIRLKRKSYTFSKGLCIQEAAIPGETLVCNTKVDILALQITQGQIYLISIRPFQKAECVLQTMLMVCSSDEDWPRASLNPLSPAQRWVRKQCMDFSPPLLPLIVIIGELNCGERAHEFRRQHGKEVGF